MFVLLIYKNYEECCSANHRLPVPVAAIGSGGHIISRKYGSDILHATRHLCYRHTAGGWRTCDSHATSDTWWAARGYASDSVSLPTGPLSDGQRRQTSRGQCQCILYARTSSRILWLSCAQVGSIKLCNIEHSDQLPAVIES